MAPTCPFSLTIENSNRWKPPVFGNTDEELESYVIKLAQRCGKHISVAEPLARRYADGRFPYRHETRAREVSTRGSAFCIRRFKDDPFSPADIVAFRTMSSLMVAYLWIAFQNEVPMLFVGGTASGKTTTLNAMCIFIPWQMKIVSIESTREVNIPQPNWVPGLTRQGFGGESDGRCYRRVRVAQGSAYVNGRNTSSWVKFVVLRLTCLFQAMATGHCAYSTVHADSVPSLVHRFGEQTDRHPARVAFAGAGSLFVFKSRPVSMDAVCVAPNRSWKSSVSTPTRWKSSPTKCSAGT